MKDRYDWRIRVMDTIAEPVPSGTRMSIYKKRNPLRLPILLTSIFGAFLASCILVACGNWTTAILPILWPAFVAVVNLIGEARWWIRNGL